MTSTHDVESVERVIAAPPEKIFELLVDPSRHHEIDGSGSVKEAKEGSTRLALGDRFGMSMKMGVPYSMVSEVIELDENRRIAWQTWPPSSFAAKLAGGRIWRYELEPVDHGTLVRESWDISQEKGAKFVVRAGRGKTRKAMEQTLERIEQIVTS
jgi:uncharacterized protein YndB with AHSA1/START domain